jgi:RNA polymerase subunit RPABC4/transcription elongation factor Spt4
MALGRIPDQSQIAKEIDMKYPHQESLQVLSKFTR